MSTIKEIIERVDENKPNAFDTKQKMAWLSALDGKIAAEVMLMSITQVRLLEYRYPDHLDCEMLVSWPHEELYDLYLEAKIDFANGEYDKYQNSQAAFNSAYDDFVCWFVSNYDPVQGYRREGVAT